MASIVKAKLDNNFDPGYSLVYDIEFQKLDNAPDRYRINPSILFSGETALTPQQLKSGLDSTLLNLKQEFKTQLITQGVNNADYHIHFSTGSVNTNE